MRSPEMVIPDAPSIINRNRLWLGALSLLGFTALHAQAPIISGVGDGASFQRGIVSVPDLVVGFAPVVVTTPAGTVTGTVNSVAAAPAFFPWAGTFVAATRQDYSPALRNGAIPGASMVPARPGDVIILWSTGLPSQPVFRCPPILSLSPSPAVAPLCMEPRFRRVQLVCTKWQSRFLTRSPMAIGPSRPR